MNLARDCAFLSRFWFEAFADNPKLCSLDVETFVAARDARWPSSLVDLSIEYCVDSENSHRGAKLCFGTYNSYQERLRIHNFGQLRQYLFLNQ